MMSSNEKTPKREKRRSSSHKASLDASQDLQFSPVAVSPGRSPLKGNLTGNARKVKDSCADWYNCIQKWETFNINALDLISQIANIKLKTVFSDAEEVDVSGDVALPEQFATICDDLYKLYQNMVKIVNKMELMTSTLKGVCDLEFHQNNNAWSEDPLFQTWPTEYFYKCSEDLLQMYKAEIKLKTVIVENIAHTSDRNLMMFYTSLWLHQPYIDSNSKITMESMLKETGHR